MCCFNGALDKVKKNTFLADNTKLLSKFSNTALEVMYLGIANELKTTVIPYNAS